MKILLGLMLVVSGYSSTYTFSVVSFTDCAITGCYNRANTSDTTFLTGWANSGTGFTFNGTPITGKVLGVMADGEIVYDPNPGRGPYCNGFNLIIATPLDLDTTTGAGNVIAQNCMADYGGSSDQHWTPGDSSTIGVCGAGDWTHGGTTVPDCTWKPRSSVLCVDGSCYLWVSRQTASGVGLFGDSTIIKSDDLGLTWVNTYTIGSPSATGALPPSPLQTGYSTAMMFPGNPATANVNVPNLAMWLSYGQDGATWANIDNNSTYMYALVANADYSGFRLMRVVRANMGNLSAGDYSYYTCPGYNTTICDGLNNANWGSSFPSSTIILPWARNTLGSAMYSSTLGTYIGFGGSGSLGNNLQFTTFPHAWGPFAATQVIAQTPSLGFVGAMMPTIQVVNSNKIRITLSATEYTRSGSGSISYYTTEITNSSGLTSGMFPGPNFIK